MNLKKKLLIHNGWITSLSSNIKSDLLSSGSSDTTIKITNKNQLLLLTLTGHKLPITDLYFSKIKPLLYSSSNSIISFDLTKNSIHKEYLGYNFNSICEYNNLIVSAADTVRIYDSRQKNVILSFGKDPTIVKVFKDFIIYGSKDGSIRIYDRGFVYAKMLHVRPVKDILICKFVLNKGNKYHNDNIDSHYHDLHYDNIYYTDNNNYDDINNNYNDINNDSQSFLKEYSIISLSSTRFIINEDPFINIKKGMNMLNYRNSIYITNFEGEILKFDNFNKEFYRICKGDWLFKSVVFDDKIVTGGENIQYFY